MERGEGDREAPREKKGKWKGNNEKQYVDKFTKSMQHKE